MIKTTKILMNDYNNYSNIFNKIKSLVDTKKLFLVTKGIYETNPNIEGYYLANIIYGPSYLSFDFALSYYGLIPERVYTYTSATCLKKKSKTYSNQFGNYTYNDVPSSVFSYFINIKEENGYTYFIASKEKALCDKLYSLKPISNQKELSKLLFEDLRIDEYELTKLNLDDIDILSSLYKSKNVKLLNAFLRRYRK